MGKGNPIRIISVYRADWDALRADLAAMRKRAETNDANFYEAQEKIRGLEADLAALERKNELLAQTIECGNMAKDAEIAAMKGSNTELIKCFVETEVENIAKGERIAELEAALKEDGNNE